MATRERVRVGGPTGLTGTHEARCASAEHGTSAAGNAMVVWVFQIPGAPGGPAVVRRHTLLRSEEIYETAMALGLGKEFKLSQAAGRKCRLTLASEGAFTNVAAAKPL